MPNYRKPAPSLLDLPPGAQPDYMTNPTMRQAGVQNPMAMMGLERLLQQQGANQQGSITQLLELLKRLQLGNQMAQR